MQRKPLTFASVVIIAFALSTGTAIAETGAVTSPVVASETAEAQTPAESAVAGYRAAFKAMRDAGQWPGMEERAKMADEALADLDPAALSVDDMDTLFAAIPVVYSSHTQAFDDRLAELSQGDTPEAARAASLRFHLLDRETTSDQRAKMIADLFKQPGLVEAWKQGKAYESFGSFGRLDEEDAAALLPDFVALGTTDTDQMPPLYFSRMASAFYALADAGAESSIATREPLRIALVEALDTKLGESDLSEDDTRVLTTSRDRLNGAYARGQLVGHTAPELHFIKWINPNNADESYAKLSDIKDKVVVLDFWATWCGPCVASFPHVKELQERYDGYDVVIIGVTSIQGAHYTGDARGKIDCTDDPDKEIALMPEFMQAKDVTWCVAFAQEPVYNHDYGVNGIPHVAILDTQGVVRFRGLHPAMPMEQKTSKIDQLLTEAGKPVPPAIDDPAPEEATAEAVPQGGE